MLEYAKCILPNVCTWEPLFRKELKKCYDWMDRNEIPVFYNWCYANFNQLHPDVLADVFRDYKKKPVALKLSFTRSRIRPPKNVKYLETLQNRSSEVVL